MKLNKIREVLEERGISQMWLSKRLGKSYGMVNAYGSVTEPNLVWDVLLQIAAILQVDLKDLITDKDERE